MHYKRRVISKELFEWCLKEGYGDRGLIAKWRKEGYESLCCLRCVQVRDTNFGTVCICRVPRRSSKAKKKKNKKPKISEDQEVEEEKVTEDLEEEEVSEEEEEDHSLGKPCVHCGCTGCGG